MSPSSSTHLRKWQARKAFILPQCISFLIRNWRSTLQEVSKLDAAGIKEGTHLHIRAVKSDVEPMDSFLLVNASMDKLY